MTDTEHDAAAKLARVAEIQAQIDALLVIIREQLTELGKPFYEGAEPGPDTETLKALKHAWNRYFRDMTPVFQDDEAQVVIEAPPSLPQDAPE